MKKLYFCLLYSLFLTIFSASISAQSTREIEGILNSLSPEQRMKVEGYRNILSSGDRKIKDFSNYEGKASAMDMFAQKGSETNDKFSEDSDSESENEKDSLYYFWDLRKL